MPIKINPKVRRILFSRLACSTTPLFDHLVGALLEEPGHFEADRLRGLEIDHELDPGGLLDRNVAGPDALENAVDVAGDLAERIADVRPV